MTIGADTSVIKEGAFSQCSSLIHINVKDDNQYYTSIDDVLFDEKTLMDMVLALLMNVWHAVIHNGYLLTMVVTKPLMLLQ